MVRPRGRIRHVGMNKTESAYAVTLEERRIVGEIMWYRFEGIKLRLADSTFYTPDFVVMDKEGLISLHEVKGYWEDDARVKVKVIAEMYPFPVFAITKQAQKRGGGWTVEEF